MDHFPLDGECHSQCKATVQKLNVLKELKTSSVSMLLTTVSFNTSESLFLISNAEFPNTSSLGFESNCSNTVSLNVDN